MIEIDPRRHLLQPPQCCCAVFEFELLDSRNIALVWKTLTTEGKVFTVTLSLLSFFCSEEKPVGFRLKPPTLIHGQAPSSGQCRKSLCD